MKIKSCTIIIGGDELLGKDGSPRRFTDIDINISHTPPDPHATICTEVLSEVTVKLKELTNENKM